MNVVTRLQGRNHAGVSANTRRALSQGGAGQRGEHASQAAGPRSYHKSRSRSRSRSRMLAKMTHFLSASKPCGFGLR